MLKAKIGSKVYLDAQYSSEYTFEGVNGPKIVSGSRYILVRGGTVEKFEEISQLMLTKPQVQVLTEADVPIVTIAPAIVKQIMMMTEKGGDLVITISIE